MSNQGLSIFDDEPTADSTSAEKQPAAEAGDAEKTQVIPVLDDAPEQELPLDEGDDAERSTTSRSPQTRPSRRPRSRSRSSRSREPELVAPAARTAPEPTRQVRSSGSPPSNAP